MSELRLDVEPPRRLRLAARSDDETAAAALERLRFALGVDDDLAPYHPAFRDDPLLGRALRAHPALRVARRPVLPQARGPAPG